MLTMRTDHRQAMISALLRTLKGAERVAVGLPRLRPPANSWAATLIASPIGSVRGWSDNTSAQALRSALILGSQAGIQNGLALYELTRNPRELSVPLAAVTRAAIEAYGRVFWLLEPEEPNEVVRRLASLEHSELNYPERFGSSLRRLPLEVTATHPVDEHRRRIKDWATEQDLKVEQVGYSRLAIHLLDQLYDDGASTYSEVSATTHGLGWATANFFDFNALQLRMNDQQLMDYSMSVLNATRVVVDLLADRFGLASPMLDRWQQSRDCARAMTSSFVSEKR